VVAFFISVQANDHVIRSPKNERLMIGRDPIPQRRDRPNMNAGSFDEYISTLILPYIAMV
jgi:hypothetical protein